MGMKIRNTVFRFMRRYDLFHFMPMVFYLLGYMVWFHVIEIIPRRFYLQILLRIDRFIPFVEWFVLPYISWFLFMPALMASLYFRDRDAYDRASTFLMVGMTVFLVISSFLPNRQPLRLVELPRDNMFTAIIRKLWKSDTPTNVFPSIHVYNTVSLEVVLLRSKHPKYRKPRVRILTSLWSLSIVLSTLFIKQHSMFDVMTALLCVLICSYFVLEKNYVMRFPGWDAYADRISKNC